MPYDEDEHMPVGSLGCFVMFVGALLWFIILPVIGLLYLAGILK